MKYQGGSIVACWILLGGVSFSFPTTHEQATLSLINHATDARIHGIHPIPTLDSISFGENLTTDGEVDVRISISSQDASSLGTNKSDEVNLVIANVDTKSAQRGDTADRQEDTYVILDEGLVREWMANQANLDLIVKEYGVYLQCVPGLRIDLSLDDALEIVPCLQPLFDHRNLTHQVVYENLLFIYGFLRNTSGMNFQQRFENQTCLKGRHVKENIRTFLTDISDTIQQSLAYIKTTWPVQGKPTPEVCTGKHSWRTPELLGAYFALSQWFNETLPTPQSDRHS